MKTDRFIQVEEANHAVRLLCWVREVARAAYYAWRAGEPHTQRRSDRQLLVHIRAYTAATRVATGPLASPRSSANRASWSIASASRASCGTTTSKAGSSGGIAPPPPTRNTGCRWPRTSSSSRGDRQRLVGWAMDDTIETSLCRRALDRALATRSDVQGTIHHTDRGSQYASSAYRERIAKAGMVASMSRNGDCWDNAVAEGFFGTLEQELVLETPWRDLPAARHAVSAYLHRYTNTQRRLSTLGQVAPAVYEARYHAAVMAAA